VKALMHILTILWCAVCLALAAVLAIVTYRQSGAYLGAAKIGYFSVPFAFLAFSILSFISYRFLIGLGLLQLVVALIAAWQILGSGSEGDQITSALAVVFVAVPMLISFSLFAWNRASRLKVQSSPAAEF